MRVKLSVLAVKAALSKWDKPYLRQSFAYSVRHGYSALHGHHWSATVDGFTYNMYAEDWRKATTS